jgi:outer membrane cobalamin receptor
MRGRSRGYYIFLALFFLPLLAVAQSVTIRGYVKDANSGEYLLGANIFSQLNGEGTNSNMDGYYELKVPAGESTRIRFTYIGYLERYVDFRGWRDTTLTITLHPREQQLEEVVVAARSVHTRYSSSLMNVNYLSAEDVRNSPALLGEPDVIKVLQLKPGIQSGNEGSSGFFVRGGQADQNLVLFDGAPVYNPTHLFGMFSLFSTDAIEDVRLYKGGFPARFGGRLSSVMDIGIRAGSKEKFKVSGGTGLLSSRLTAEVPLVKEKVSLLVTGRRTYFDLITKEINKANEGNSGFQPIPDYYFYDLSAKLHADLGDNDQLSFTGYTGRDHFNFVDAKIGIDFIWGNKVGVMQWDHAYNRKLSHSINASYSDYQYRIRNRFNESNLTVGSGINDMNLKADFYYAANRRHRLSFGAHYTYHKFNVFRDRESDPEGVLRLNTGEKDQALAHEAAIYVADEWQISDRWHLNAGIRLSGFTPENTSSQEARKGTYYGVEPRLSAKYQAGRALALKGSYSRVNQYVHLVSSSGASLPANFWYPSNQQIAPQIAEQVAAGADWLLAGGKFMLSNELYYRNMENQIDFRDGAELFSGSAPTQDLVFGKGWAYGNEFYIEKKEGSTTGWVAYTLSWSYRKFDEINGGTVFPSTQDRRHDISIVLRQRINDRFAFNANWVFCSGNVTSLPQARMLLQGNRGTEAVAVPIYTQRNAFRLDNYHRLDLGLEYQLKPRWGEADLTFGVYNAYDRRNSYFIYFEEESRLADGSPNFKARLVSLFPVLPSVNFNYRF